jgi:zinc/manganese transport system substrate-binding protein
MNRLFTLGALALCACLPLSAQASLKVFACEPEWGALATELGGSNVDVYSATNGLQDPHQVQARPSLIAHYRNADLAVCTGAELEIGWLPILLSNGANPKIQPGQPGMFEAFKFVSMKEVPDSVDRINGDVHPEGNPHLQTDPRNMGLVAKALTERLAQIDAAHADDYHKRGADFQVRWQAALAKWSEQAKPLNGLPALSYHKEWIYLYDFVGMKEVGTLEPKPGIPPSAAHLEELLANFKQNPAKMVVYAAYNDAHAADYFSQKAGIPVVKLPFTVGGVDGTADLFNLYQVSIDRLVAAAAGKSTE